MGIFFGCHSSPVDGFHSYVVNWGRGKGGGGGYMQLGSLCGCYGWNFIVFVVSGEKTSLVFCLVG